MAEIIFGIDHGNGNMKGENVCFPCGLVRYVSEPGRFMNEDILEYQGTYYTLSDTKMPFKADKTVDDDYFILTLYALAMEARNKGIVQEKNAEQSAEEVEKKPEEAQKPVKKILYPEAWTYNFGESTNRTVFLQRVAYRGNWDILRPATTVEGMEIITREVLDDLLESAEKLIDKMRCANYA